MDNVGRVRYASNTGRIRYAPTIKSSFRTDILHHQSGESEAEDGCDVGGGAVDLCLGGAPLVVDEVGVACRDDGFGTKAGTGAAGGHRPFVGQHFGRIDALELFARVLAYPFEPFTQGTRQWASLHFPELSDRHLGGIHLEGGSHGGVELAWAFGGVQDQPCLVLQAVNGVDDVVVGFQMELRGVLGGVDFLDGVDFRLRVDVEQPFLERFHLDLSHRLGGGLELPVDVGDAHAVAIDDGEVADAIAYQALGAPAPDAAHAEDDDPLVGDAFHRRLPDEQGQAVVYGVFYAHAITRTPLFAEHWPQRRHAESVEHDRPAIAAQK